MRFLIILGTGREGRTSIKPAEKLEKLLEKKGHQASIFDVKDKDIPPVGKRTYIEDEQPVPDDIQNFSDQVQDSDGIIIVFPEYNHSIPGILKTTLDYLYPEYDEKPFAFVPVSAGGFGGVRGLQHLHDIVLELGGYIGPDLPVSNAREVFNDEGEFLDGDYQERFQDFVEETEEFVEGMQKN